MEHDALTVHPGSMGSDSSLIEAIASGNEDALAELFRRHRRSVFAVVIRILSCPADAEEVVQDVFLQVWKHALRFRGDSQVTTWLHTIARNAAVSRLRRADSETTPLDLLVRSRGDLASDQPNPERQAAAAESVRRMWSRIMKLPATHRAVVVGILRHGSPTTVAARHHVGTGTVRSRLHRVRLALRATLENQCRSMP
jgi:RNA polymerase sigma-70 factor (ECF subfamily)